jgi:hypothetical protein
MRVLYAENGREGVEAAASPGSAAVSTRTGVGSTGRSATARSVRRDSGRPSWAGLDDQHAAPCGWRAVGVRGEAGFAVASQAAGCGASARLGAGPCRRRGCGGFRWGRRVLDGGCTVGRYRVKQLPSSWVLRAWMEPPSR